MKVGFAAIALVGSVGLSVAISIPSREEALPPLLRNSRNSESHLTYSLPLSRSEQPFNITTDSAASVLNPYPNKPRIAFKPDGTFKITVFSDLHFGENPWDEWGPEQDRNSTKLMRKVLKEERPDYAYVMQTFIGRSLTLSHNSTES